MTVFEYLSALVSVVVGLAIAQTLRGLLRLVHHRTTAKWSWTPFIWTVSMMLWTVYFWWFTFGLSQLDHWQMRDLFFVLAYGAALYFLLGLLFPDDVGDHFDMHEHFDATRPWFFGLLFALGVFELVDVWIKLSADMLQPSGLGWAYYFFFMATWLIGSGVAARVRRRSFQTGFAVIYLILMSVHVVDTAAQLAEVG